MVQEKKERVCTEHWIWIQLTWSNYPLVQVSKKDILSELAGATNDISQGELIQLDAISNIKISLNKLKKISYFKTGRLFEASAKTGAMLAGANKNFIKNIGESAKNIGILFQIKDDLLDYSNTSKTGKQSFQDLKEGRHLKQITSNIWTISENLIHL